MVLLSVLVAESCLTLCDSMDCRLPGSSVHGILQARILEWVAISFSRGSSQLKDQTYVSYVSCTGQVGSLPLALPGKPGESGMLLNVIYSHRLYLIKKKILLKN